MELLKEFTSCEKMIVLPDDYSKLQINSHKAPCIKTKNKIKQLQSVTPKTNLYETISKMAEVIMLLCIYVDFLVQI